MKQLKSHKTFDGKTEFWSHESVATRTTMKFSTFIPHGEVKGCLIWLSGLTCTEENFITKAGAQKYLAEKNLMVIAPDTSPRGLNLPGEHDSYDFGSGAGFYVNAKVSPYNENYRMYDYINSEIYDIVKNEFKVNRISLFGHSMGGHGSLVIGLKNADKYESISAFSPIANPSIAPWGMKAFKGYLGEDESAWLDYDATELLKSGRKHPGEILIHQGLQDEFYTKELMTNNFREAALKMDQKHKIQLVEGYDHSYYFIATFMKEHIDHHAYYLNSESCK